MKAMITFRHDLTEAELEAMRPRLREAFNRVGMDFDACLSAGVIGFERVAAAFKDAQTNVLKLSCALDKAKALNAALLLKQTAWERQNPNAPWWRKFERRRRA